MCDWLLALKKYSCEIHGRVELTGFGASISKRENEMTGIGYELSDMI